MSLHIWQPSHGERVKPMIAVTRKISIDSSEVQFDFVRASGPGGQNVNKVATAVQLRFNVADSPSLPEAVRSRLIRLAGRRMTRDGVLIIEAKRFRNQQRNRQEAIDQFTALVRQAIKVPKVRRSTKPTGAAKQRRLEAKRRHSLAKRRRRPVSRDEE